MKAPATGPVCTLRSYVARGLARIENEVSSDLGRREMLADELKDLDTALVSKQQFIRECYAWLKDYPE